MRLFNVSKQVAETGSDLYSIIAELNVTASALHQQHGDK